MTIPSDKLAKWGPMSSKCLEYASKTVGGLPLAGGLAQSLCSEAAEYVDKLSDKTHKNALQGLEQDKENRLVG